MVDTLARPAAIPKRQNIPLEPYQNLAEIAATKAAERTAKANAKHEAERIKREKEVAAKVLARNSEQVLARNSENLLSLLNAQRDSTTTAKPPNEKAAVGQHSPISSAAASANPAELAMQGYQAKGYQAQHEDSDADLANIEKM